MASSSSDDVSLDSDLEAFASNSKLADKKNTKDTEDEPVVMEYNKPNSNIINKIINRQIYGKINRHSKSSTEGISDDIFYKCRYGLGSVIPREAVSHYFMGFTLCSKYFLSYTIKLGEPSSGTSNGFPYIEYELHIWRFVPGQKLQFISKHKIFKLFKSSLGLDEVTFMQFPTDPYKIICFASVTGNPTMSFLTVLTLPAKNCTNCKSKNHGGNDKVTEAWCSKHGFILHFMFTISHPEPVFDPHISLAYPDHIVINTGHCIHILNFATLEPIKTVIAFNNEYDNSKQVGCNCIDTLSEVSESPSEIYSNSNSIVDAILEDFGEYDLEGNDNNKPFHELNISCDPLNVTGKTYHNALVHNIVDNRIKHFHNGNNKDCLFSVPQSSGLQKQLEKTKIDKKIAEKTYEFIEENEKCENLSLFRKKRLADKKYEFSEDNSENIVPFYSLRREKRCLLRPQNYCIKSPEFKSLFLSPRSPGLRSPMQSPNSRSGQFSPVGSRNLYCSVIRTNSNFSKSPISPRDSARKINVYSPSIDSDCSDSESRLILRPAHNYFTSHNCDNKMSSQHSLLIVDSKHDETPKWIKKVVKRYSSVDFENSSLLSGQSRDDYNVPIEIPVLVQGLSEQNLDIIPEAKADQVFETQLKITQRTLDCDQFVQSRAQKLCLDAKLEFLHCEDYDIRIIHICPLNGHIICRAVIAIGALEDLVPYVKRNVYVAEFIFTWNIVDNTFDVIEPPEKLKFETKWTGAKLPMVKIPSIVRRKVLVMDHIHSVSKSSLTDYNNCYEICIEGDFDVSSGSEFNEFSIPSDSDMDF